MGMLTALKKQIEVLLSGNDSADTEADRQHGIRLATATLMAEVARADRVFDTRELSALREGLQRHFGLTDEETAMVVDAGLEEAEAAISLQGFTRPLHEALSAVEKAQIVDMLWRVAAADGELDKHEDALIGKIGELLYVPRSEVLRLKHENGL
ncbi:MAG: TerB family tellurite resistance protein [Pseudomonadota bacterium]